MRRRRAKRAPEPRSGHLPTDEYLDAAQKKLKLPLPQSYRRFCAEVGPGRFDSGVIICVPCEDRKFLYRPHRLRGLHADFGKKDIAFAHLLLPDGSWTGDRIFWKGSEPAAGKEVGIHLFEVQTGKVRKLADTFEALILELCLGSQLSEMGLRASPPRLGFQPIPWPSARLRERFEQLVEPAALSAQTWDETVRSKMERPDPSLMVDHRQRMWHLANKVLSHPDAVLDSRWPALVRAFVDSSATSEDVALDIAFAEILASPAAVEHEQWADLMLYAIEACQRCDTVPTKQVRQALTAGANHPSFSIVDERIAAVGL